MEVISFLSTDGRIDIHVSTPANIGRLWHRFRARVQSTDEALAYCDYKSTVAGIFTLAVAPDFILVPVTDTASDCWLRQPPVFYETVPYSFAIRIRNIESEPHVVHRLNDVTERFSAIRIGDNEWLLTGQLDFLNEPGTFDLAFSYKPTGSNERTEKFQFQVVSPKLDTKNDYNRIIADINNQYNEIIFQYLTKTFQNFSVRGRSNNNEIWLSVFGNIVKQYIKAVAYIVGRPHLRECRNISFGHAESIRKWTPAMEQKYVEAEYNNTHIIDYFRYETIESTVNTRENRFVKFTIDKISHRLSQVFGEIMSESVKTGVTLDKSLISEVQGYMVRLRQLSQTHLLRKLRGEPLHSESIVLQKRTGYAQIYRCWLILHKGIDLCMGQYGIGMRPIWELYELWCFLKMRSTIADILNLDFADSTQIIDTPVLMREPFSDSLAYHLVTYYHNGDIITLEYQRTFNRKSGLVHTATTDNRPDIVLTIHKPDGIDLTYLYDAKYRVIDDNFDSADDGADYPPPDAINQMHRYRDAIYFGKKEIDGFRHAAKEVIGGYILFPGRGNDSSIKQKYYYKSIETVNIGAFPLLPSHDNMVCENRLFRNHLVRILIEQSAYQQIKDSIPQRGLTYSASLSQSNNLILIGYYKTDDWNAICTHLLYYVPAASGKGSINLVSGYEFTKYLLLHHGKNRILLELTGEGPTFYPGDRLREMGFTPEGSDYLVFKIKSLTPVNITGIDPMSINLRQRGLQSYRPYFATFQSLLPGT